MYNDMDFPGHGYLPRPGEDRPALDGWARLSRGGAIGKKINLAFDASNGAVQRSLTSILQLEGDDADARQLTVTLSPPMAVATPFSSALARIGLQERTGEQDNIEMQSRATFPGMLVPIQWPPVEAVIEWGIGGASNRATVDFMNGTAINLTASFLRISAVIVSGDAIDITGTSAIYTLSAFVGPGFARPGVAQKTVYVGSVDSLAESRVFPVPRFAKSAYVVGCDPQAGPAIAITVATLRLWQSPDGVAGGNNVGNFVVSGNQPLPFDLPNGAAYASVLSGMAVGSRFSIIYNLAI